MVDQLFQDQLSNLSGSEKNNLAIMVSPMTVDNLLQVEPSNLSRPENSSVPYIHKLFDGVPFSLRRGVQLIRIREQHSVLPSDRRPMMVYHLKQ